MDPRLPTNVRLVLVIHHRELKKPSNTGMVAVRSLENSEYHTVGLLNRPLDYSEVVQEGATNLMLFPGPDAKILTPELCQTFSRPIRLIVPDGNWGQGTRMGRRLLQQRNISCVTLPHAGPSQFVLRRESEDRPQGLATCEAIARAYTLLESPEAGQHIFDAFVSFYHQIRAAHRRDSGI